MQAEEQRHPKAIKNKLQQIKSQCDFYQWLRKTFLPDERRRKSHKQIQHGPDGAEDPIRRCEKRLVEFRIPLLYLQRSKKIITR